MAKVRISFYSPVKIIPDHPITSYIYPVWPVIFTETTANCPNIRSARPGMHIRIEPYNLDWPLQFEKLKMELSGILQDFHPVIEHFGSTSVPGLAAKPVIDILVGIPHTGLFDALVANMTEHPRYVYFKAFDAGMPDRRLYVRLKDEAPLEAFPQVYAENEDIRHDSINLHRWAHVHIWAFGSENWIRHIAFRDYLKCHPDVCRTYEDLKMALSHQQWENGMAYNQAKNDFLKDAEKKAVAWYLEVDRLE